MNRRSGITLIEVLASIFIMGIGLLALLTLFPLGALEMAQSIRDDRMGHIKHSAAAIANAYDVRRQPQVLDGMLNPGGGLTSYYLPGPPPQQVDPSLGTLPSYPVFVDAVGYNFTPASARQIWVAGIPPGPPGPQPPGAPGTVPRRVSYNPVDPNAGVIPRSRILTLSALLDDIRFLDHGIPTPGLGPSPLAGFLRTYGFSWAYLCKMPQASAGIVELTVIIYRGRPFDPDSTSGETAYSASFDTSNNTITIGWAVGQTPPDVASGNWVFDGTMTKTLANGSVVPDPHGYFYRVLSATQLTATTMEIEVQQPLRAGAPGGSPGVLIIMDGVIGVFERGTY